MSAITWWQLSSTRWVFISAVPRVQAIIPVESLGILLAYKQIGIHENARPLIKKMVEGSFPGFHVVKNEQFGLLHIAKCSVVLPLHNDPLQRLYTLKWKYRCVKISYTDSDKTFNGIIVIMTKISCCAEIFHSSGATRNENTVKLTIIPCRCVHHAHDIDVPRMVETQLATAIYISATSVATPWLTSSGDLWNVCWVAYLCLVWSLQRELCLFWALHSQ